MAQAEPTHTTSPSRRSILRGAAAAPIASIVGLAEFVADADLIMLGHQLDEGWAAEKALYKKWADLDDPEADREITAAFEATKAIVELIEHIPAQTMHGIKVKMRACAWCRDDDPFEEPIRPHSTDVRLALSICNDLWAMGA